MAPRKPGYIHDVDQLIADTPLDAVLQHFQKPLPEKASGEHRLTCPFNPDCADTRYGQLTVNLDDPANRIYCHSCQVRGNLLTLLFGLEHGRAPAGGRLRGDEFKAAVSTLRTISEGSPRAVKSTGSASPPGAESKIHVDTPRNVPLRRHEKEAAQALENLYEDLVTDPAEMPPEAAAWFRQRPWLTPDVARQWRMGYLPKNGRSLFRGSIVSAHCNQRGEVLSYSGRDPGFEKKWEQWLHKRQPEEKKPAKHRFVSGYHRGLELYGQQTVRLEQAAIRDSLSRTGLIVVEGASDVIRLDTLHIAAVGLCSNRATTEQIAKITSFARTTAGNRIVLLPDCDAEGESGARELLWQLNERQLMVQLGWSASMFGGRFAGKQPEDLSEEQARWLMDQLLVPTSTP